jgi:hypothetical protein
MGFLRVTKPQGSSFKVRFKEESKMLELVLSKINSYAKHEMSTKNLAMDEFQFPEVHSYDIEQVLEQVSKRHANRLSLHQNLGATI